MKLGAQFLLFAAMAVPGIASASCTVSVEATLPLTVDGSRLSVPISMNETPGQFMIDTGSERTLLSDVYAQRSSVGMDVHAGRMIYSGAGGRETLPVNQAHVRSIQVGTIAFQDWEFAVLPTGESGAFKMSGDGILGMDFLHYFDMDVDLESHKVTLWRVQGCNAIHPVWQGAYDTIPLKGTVRQGVTAPILVNNAILDVTFDTGAGGLLLTRDAGARAGVTDAMLAKDEGSRARGIGGKFPAVEHRFNLLLVGQAEFDHPIATVETESHEAHYSDGLIDWRYLKARRFWVSFTTQTLFVQGAGK
jgi:hypothetical protein